eukprot:365159-Chlamydomonas_euryale.AAC.26
MAVSPGCLHANWCVRANWCVHANYCVHALRGARVGFIFLDRSFLPQYFPPSPSCHHVHDDRSTPKRTCSTLITCLSLPRPSKRSPRMNQEVTEPTDLRC